MVVETVKEVQTVQVMEYFLQTQAVQVVRTQSILMAVQLVNLLSPLAAPERLRQILILLRALLSGQFQMASLRSLR
jgi:hypothetical protein